ncbi:TetR/AcrR family transcriptional regulator [Bradyrhizobium sp. GCM10027634]|uniref:TetR/AcrR family transcriptional regulator n=1 Tax=unclassified Bradyrhizobium TaxID=2631580 RepID=UPI00188B05E2|nr:MULTISPECIES: TetR/AcrR family transcriptional regulator [unclassified Bradyrhizobium]MDN4999457.1 TetR/AcrR family transcriptional regulator [Bradyrhizobium sp. WYCCWR 12677]QOZ43607.1 TetR/AcrR family transcriptional regulator [Bradyrhizobium sp. CCBAU 53340]
MAGRPREFDREAALEAAMLLFWRKGFASASMNDLCEAMGVRSPSLYAAFESKEALYLAAIEHYVLTKGPPVWDRLGEGATAREGIANLLHAAADILPKSRSAPAGCMVVLGAVSDEWPASIARAVKKVRLDMLGNLRARLQAAVVNGELSAATDIDALSRFYLSVYQGMAIQARDGAAQAELKGAADAAMAAWPGRTLEG